LRKDINFSSESKHNLFEEPKQNNIPKDIVEEVKQDGGERINSTENKFEDNNVYEEFQKKVKAKFS